ncbi:CAP domain-containing protein [Texcoconibacillus texcoconensis]|uniref:Uncharacterized protein YkwD n=1 Tax=Texcoconibacillus texcoconensis TaxID=1095777 RepID=A0A840QRE3_9BACI|nr:CAP domain-containing protein [Texcoconibacillus texcoconensis]MBB5173857.1 uncharacterized protein YkwD [Texcoconibacillus texcoconensis]
MRTHIKSILASAVVTAGLSGAPTLVEANNVTDVAGHWAENQILWSIEEGFVKGYENGTFQPDENVSEKEFLTMLARFYNLDGRGEGEPVYEVINDYGMRMIGYYNANMRAAAIDRGQVARLLAHFNGASKREEEAITWLYEVNLTEGRDDRSDDLVERFQPSGSLTRAEAVTFFHRLAEQGRTEVDERSEPARHFELEGIALRDDKADVIEVLGAPERVASSQYEFDWYVYHDDYEGFMMFGVDEFDEVAGFYLKGGAFETETGLKPGLSEESFSAKYESYKDSYNVTNDISYGVDEHMGDEVVDMKVVDRSIGYKDVSDLDEAGVDGHLADQEQLMFDYTNAARVFHGEEPLDWHEGAAQVAKGHSCHMAAEGYFDHDAPDGTSARERVEAGDIEGYRYGGENIAIGHWSAMDAHRDLMNSLGHRNNILRDRFEAVGIGIVHSNQRSYYYTENFLREL